LFKLNAVEKLKPESWVISIKTLLKDATEQIDIDNYSVDVCLMATVLHDFEEINKAGIVLKQIKTILKPGGYLAVIEFKKIEGPPGPPVKIRLSEDEVEKMVTGYGFQKEKTADIGDYNYLMTFQSIWVGNIGEKDSMWQDHNWLVIIKYVFNIICIEK